MSGSTSLTIHYRSGDKICRAELKGELMEIGMVTLEEVNELIFTPLEEGRSEDGEQAFATLRETFNGFPKGILRLFEMYTSAIVLLPLHQNWSAITCATRVGAGKNIIVVTPRAIEERDIKVVLLHELGHTLDFSEKPPFLTPAWAWGFISRFENLARNEEREPLEGINRERGRFGGVAEEWASRLGATLICEYGLGETVTSLRQVPVFADAFQRHWKRSYKLLREYLRCLERGGAPPTLIQRLLKGRVGRGSHRNA